MTTDQHTITVQDTLGRHWTIVTEPTAVGFRWRVYLHGDTVGVAALELVYPGGVAWGWTDDEHADERNVRAWLDAAMRIKGATAKPDDTTGAIGLYEAWALAKQWVTGGPLDPRLLGWVKQRMEREPSSQSVMVATVFDVLRWNPDGTEAEHWGGYENGKAQVRTLCELAGWPS